MLAESHDEEQIIARVVALDIGKAELVCCVRVPAPAGNKRRLAVTTHSTMTRALPELANRRVELHVERVVMEATSSYRSLCSTCSKRTGWIRGWSTPAMSSICLADRKPMCRTLFGCAMWPSGRRCGLVSCRLG